MTADLDFDALIIGAGHNGLVCAGYLAMAGMKVGVLERRPMVGGAATTEELFPGYRLSACSYICHLLQGKVIDDLELRKHGFEIFRLNPRRFSPYLDGRSLLFWDSAEGMKDEIGKFSKKDAEAYPRLQAFWKRAAGMMYPYFLTPPPSLATLRANLKSADDRAFLDRLLTVSVQELVDEYFEDPAIKGACASTQDVGSPSAPGSAWGYAYFRCAMFTADENDGLVRGGMGAITQAMASSARERGATIRTDAPVARILVKDGAAFGVRLEDGTEMTSGVVISNADPKRTFLKLLSKEDLPGGFPQSVRELKTNVSYLKFHAALNRLPDFSQFFDGTCDPKCLAMTKICPSVEYLDQAWNDARSGRPARAPVMEIQVPSVYDDSLAAPGHHVLSVWGQYAPVRLAEGTWDERREQVGEDLIDTIAQYAPDIRDCIADWSLFTPLDIERRVAMTDGNIRHLDVVPSQMLDQRPLQDWAGYETPVQHLYLCGSGTHPGGDVSGAPGHNAAHVIINRS